MNILLSILLGLIAFSGSAGLNFDAWGEEGPNGGYFEYIDDSYFSFSLSGCKQPTISTLKKYFFYKNATIGIYEQEGGRTQFFIVRADDCLYESFKNEANWKNRIEELELSPVLWTRWHTQHWSFLFSPERGSTFVFVPLLGVFFLILLLGSLAVFFAKTSMHFAKRAFRLRSLKSWILVALNLVVFTTIALSIFPGSF